MKGHIRERSPGYWAIVIELRDDVTKHALRNIRRTPARTINVFAVRRRS
jgi:hypothetical protein